MTIDIAPPYVISGQAAVDVSGQLTGAGADGRTVVLLQEVPPGKTFSSEGKTLTNGSGHYRFVLPIGTVVSNRTWYVTGPGGVRSSSLTEQVGAAFFHLGVGPSGGVPLALSGDISPVATGEVVLEQEVGSTPSSGWEELGSTPVKAGHFLLPYEPTAVGRFTLRAWFGGSKELYPTGSHTVSVVVHASELPPTTTATTSTTTPAPATLVMVTAGAPGPYSFTLLTSTQPKVISDVPATELTVPAGEVTFDVTNPEANILSHNFKICSAPLPKPVTTLPGVNSLPDDCSGESTAMLAPGGAPAKLSVDLATPGAYEYLSTANPPKGDAFAGMKGVLNVT